MASCDSDSSSPRFETTHWTVIAAARDRDAPESRQALAELCRTYWYPLYAFFRRKGNSADEAQDLTQGLFARLLEHDFLRSVDRAKGRFRSFLLAAGKHFLANEYDRNHALKRGGGRHILSIDGDRAEAQYRSEPTEPDTPEKLFERRWALTLLEKVFERLREEYDTSGKRELFEFLKGSLAGDRGLPSYREAAAALGITEDAVKTAAYRLRRRYRDLLREEISRTVDSPAAIEDEIRDLFTALAP